MDMQAHLKHFVTALHRDWEGALSGLTDEQFHFRPSESTNHIAFTAWHLVRTEDNIVQFVLQRKQTVWLERGLNDAWGLPKAAQGTGMPSEEAVAMHLPGAEPFLQYARGVWAATDAYLSTLTAEELARVARVMPFGEIPVSLALGQTIIAHGNQHLGEVWLSKELQGLTGIGR